MTVYRKREPYLRCYWWRLMMALSYIPEALVAIPTLHYVTLGWTLAAARRLARSRLRLP